MHVIISTNQLNLCVSYVINFMGVLYYLFINDVSSVLTKLKKIFY